MHTYNNDLYKTWCTQAYVADGDGGPKMKTTCFLVDMCLEIQPRWRRLQTINSELKTLYIIRG